MDAVEFLKERVRMCDSFDGCDGCPLQNECLDTEIEAMVNTVEQWVQSHPQKTMIQDFFEKFPNAPRTKDGTPRNICPCDCGYTNKPENYSTCDRFNNDCAACWSRQLEE